VLEPLDGPFLDLAYAFAGKTVFRRYFLKRVAAFAINAVV